MARNLLAICVLLLVGSAFGNEEDSWLEEVLLVPPKVRVGRAVAEGDTRYMSTPRCAERPAFVAIDLLPKGGDAAIDSNCRIVFGREGAARLQKLGQYADEYNQMMFEYIKSNGIFTIYPRNAVFPEITIAA